MSGSVLSYCAQPFFLGAIMATFAEVEEGCFFLSLEEGGEWYQRLCGTSDLPELSPGDRHERKNCIRWRDKTLTHFSPGDAIGFIINTVDLLAVAQGIVEARRSRERIDRIQHDSGEIQILASPTNGT